MSDFNDENEFRSFGRKNTYDPIEETQQTSFRKFSYESQGSSGSGGYGGVFKTFFRRAKTTKDDGAINRTVPCYWHEKSN
jgi:hypothetical protein